jgi:hypothetical protein
MTTVLVDFMCQLGWAKECQVSCKPLFLGVSFLEVSSS